jgi:adenylosuccinate synthase
VRELGNEFGAVTGRPAGAVGSMPSWFVMRARVNGLSDLARHEAGRPRHARSGCDMHRYRVGDDIYHEFPGDVTALERIEPLYEWHEGWKQSTSSARTLDALPALARRYLDRIRELVDAPISYVSVGTRRDQIIGLQ